MIKITSLFNKDYPDFWKNYNNSFKSKTNKFVVVSIEASGSDPEKDAILSLACVSILENRMLLKDAFELHITQPKSKGKTTDELTETNTVSEVDKTPVNEAIENLLNYLSNAIIVGHRVDFDIEILNETLSKLKLGKLKNEVYDVEAMYNKWQDTNEKKHSLEEMCIKLAVPYSYRNSIADDAMQIGLLFLKLKEILKIK
jgi:DNA polymerase III subunit epsilon